MVSDGRTCGVSRCDVWRGKGKRRDGWGFGTRTTMLGKGSQGSQDAGVRGAEVSSKSGAWLTWMDRMDRMV